MHTGWRLKCFPRKFFAPPPGKMCWTCFKTIGHSSKDLSSSQKTLRPLASQAGYGPVYTIMHVKKERGRRGPWKNLTFSYKIFSKKVVFLVSSGKNKISSFFAPLRKILRFTWKNYYCPPCITLSDLHVHNVWLIIDNMENIVLWSGSTKGWCNRFRKQCRWFALKYFFGLRIKTLITLKIFGATFGIGGGALPPLPPWLRAWPGGRYRPLWKSLF